MFLQGFQARIAEFRVIAIHNAIINMFQRSDNIAMPEISFNAFQQCQNFTPRLWI
ncbi:hypothetical protein W824_09705 [Clavibacter cf. michiganensis LMG 26808]|nr:hypothetical protein W824_09705 [Clavibacter cf. michiganensis LMG 26808]